jgi:ABC-type transport system involved in multi-copper enzyme maturation permease subunit
MSTTMTPTANTAFATHAPEPMSAVRAEWAKLRTLRATWLTLSISVVAAIALGGLGSLSDARTWDDMTAQEQLAHDPTSTSLIGVLFGALVLGALGVRTVTSEYSTGMIRTTAAAVPNRSLIVWAKVAVVASVTFAVALGANLAGFSLGQAALASKDIGASITSGDSLAAIVLGTVAVTCFAVVGLGLGTIVRRASVANILIAVVVIGGQLVGSAIPSDSQRFLPFNALQASVTVKRGDDLLPPGAAVALLTGYAAVAVAAATIVLRRRDV